MYRMSGSALSGYYFRLGLFDIEFSLRLWYAEIPCPFSSGCCRRFCLRGNRATSKVALTADLTIGCFRYKLEVCPGILNAVED